MKRLKNNDLIEKTIKNAIGFLEKIKSSDRVSIVFGHDCDSMSSAVLIFKLIKNYSESETKLIISELNSSVTEKTLKIVKNSKPSHIIILDIPYVNVDILHEMKKIAKILIIDHHPPKGYTGICYCNPRIYDVNSYLPASYLSYKIYENFSNVEKIAWIAGIGVLGDMGMKNCEDLFQKIKTVNHELVDDIENDDKILFEKSLLGKLTNIIDSARVVKDIEGANTAVNILIKAKNFNEILNSRLIKYYKIAEKEFNRLLKSFERKKKVKKSLIIYEVKSKLNFKSSLSSYLTKFYPNKILVIYQKVGKYLEISFRKGINIKKNLGKLVEDTIKDLPNSTGGGHPSAAGARVPFKYSRRFFKKLEKRIQEKKD